MSTPIDRQIRSLDNRRNALLDELESLTPEALGWRPAAGKWSILEIVEHLVIAEREVCREIPADRVRARRLKHRFAFLMVYLVLRFRIKVKVPSPRMVPQGGWSLSEARRQWDENLERVRSFAAGLDGAGLRRAVFRHPVAGPITLAQALTLDLLHLEDHTRQVRRLRAQG